MGGERTSGVSAGPVAWEDARICRWIAFSRFHACWRTRLLSKSLTATPYASTRGSLSLFPPLVHHRLVSRHSRVPGVIVVVIVGVVKTSNNGPNDRLFSSGDIDLPANRKPVKMNPLNRYTPTNFVTASRNATSINLPPSIPSRKRFARKGCTLELPTRNLINLEAIDSK